MRVQVANAPILSLEMGRGSAHTYPRIQDAHFREIMSEWRGIDHAVGKTEHIPRKYVLGVVILVRVVVLNEVYVR